MRTPLRFASLALAALMLLLAARAAAQIKINEIRSDNDGTDTDEYFELSGPSGASLAGHTYVVIGDGSGGCGVIEAVADLTAFSIQSDGLLCLRNSGATPALTGYDGMVALIFENSDNVTHLLVTGFSGALGNDLDTNDDGVLDVTPWTSIVDCVGLSKGTVPNCAAFEEYLYCATVVGPDGTFVPGHVYRASDTQAWVIGEFQPLGTTDTPGAPNYTAAGPPPIFTDMTRAPCVPLTGQAAVVTAVVTNNPTGATLFYKLDGGAETSIAMGASGTPPTLTYQATIPAQAVNGRLVEYYVLATNANPNPSRSFTGGYFVGTKNIGDLRVNNASGENLYAFYGARVRGIVTVPYGTFGTIDTDYYIQDATGGINVFKFGTHTVQPGIEDDVTVVGTLAQYTGKLEITDTGACDTLLVTIHGTSIQPDPLNIRTCDLGETVEGRLVRLNRITLLTPTGVPFTGNTNYSAASTYCGPETVTVRIDVDTNIPGQNVATALVDVVGIANQFDSFPPFDGVYQILPRWIGDITFWDPVTEVPGAPTEASIELLPPMPNPSAVGFAIRYRIGASGTTDLVPVRLAVFDVHGRRIAVLFDGERAPGEYRAAISPGALPGNGVYFCRLEAAGQAATRRFAIVF